VSTGLVEVHSFVPMTWSIVTRSDAILSLVALDVERYWVCSRCVMDGSVPGVRFDSEGRCNFCSEFIVRWENRAQRGLISRQAMLDSLVADLKHRGRGRAYDCVVGVSGGVDSSWVLVNAVRLGLRPLAVHMDNGWNSELAQNNIANLVRGLGVDLYTHVIDWPEYRGLMQAFFDADVIDVELLYDNAMLAVNYGQAARHGVRHILAGTNDATEGMRMPPGWNWNKTDAANIRDISRRFGGPHPSSFPCISLLSRTWHARVRGIRWHSFLDLLEYTKEGAVAELQSSFGYKPYPYKHYESVFTRFYQGFILPRKFGVDKRRLHLSILVVTGQVAREAALADLRRMPYPSQEALDSDCAYFLKKMGWSKEQLALYLARPARPHTDFRTEFRWLRALRTLIGRGSVESRAAADEAGQ
jgi:N-acetyl sugar amidotransferase